MLSHSNDFGGKYESTSDRFKESIFGRTNKPVFYYVAYNYGKQ